MYMYFIATANTQMYNVWCKLLSKTVDQSLQFTNTHVRKMYTSDNQCMLQLHELP